MFLLASKKIKCQSCGFSFMVSELRIADPFLSMKTDLFGYPIDGLPFTTWTNNAYAKISPWDKREYHIDAESRSIPSTLIHPYRQAQIGSVEYNRSFNLKAGVILDVMEDLIEIRSWTYVQSKALRSLLLGYSGRDLCVWNPLFSLKNSVTVSDSFVACRTFPAIKAIIKNWCRDEMLKDSAVRHFSSSPGYRISQAVDKRQDSMGISEGDENLKGGIHACLSSALLQSDYVLMEVPPQQFKFHKGFRKATPCGDPLYPFFYFGDGIKFCTLRSNNI
ncbi:hypothetical protein Tco_1011855 [Tanacetum coccineum]